MKIKPAPAVLSGIVLLCLAALAFCQQETATGAQSSLEALSVPPEGEEDIAWVWGEIKGVDAGSSTLAVTYMDYQTDEEKELILTVDTITKFEGVKDLGEVKIGDTASIDYTVRGNKNIARNIFIEEMELMPEAPPAEEEAAPAQ